MSEDLTHEMRSALEPGEMVTVDATLLEDMGPYLYVVIDGFLDPRYTLACLGGDGYQWPNVERSHLSPVSPGHIVRVIDSDGGVGYMAA